MSLDRMLLPIKRSALIALLFLIASLLLSAIYFFRPNKSFSFLD